MGKSCRVTLSALALYWLGFVVSRANAAQIQEAAQVQEAQVALVPRSPSRVARAKSTLANLRLDVRLVLIPATVTDPTDRVVTTLPAERFRVLEDGVEQKIESFSQEEGPVSLGFLFDSSASMKNRIASSVEALKQFFLGSMEGDEYFLVQFSDHAHLLSGFTPKPADIDESLGVVQAGGWTALLDAVAMGTNEMKSAKNPRKALLILSDGGDNNSRYNEAEIRSRVMEADLRIYALGIVQCPSLLQRLAVETGGEVVIAHNLTELPEMVRRLSAAIRSQYILGYRSGATNDGKYHKVKVELRPEPGAPLHVSWRRGYFSPDE